MAFARHKIVEDWLKHVQDIENEFRTLENEVQMEVFIRQFFGGDRAAKLNARVYELVEQSRHFRELGLDVPRIRGEALLRTRMIGEAFEENLERIWKLLVIDKVSSIGIHVSQVFIIKKLQDEIADVVGLDLSNEYNEGKRAARLNGALSLRKNFVLILEDVWESINLEKLGDPLSVEGYRLMITTRSSKVCLQIGYAEMIEVKTPHTDEGWSLFSEELGKEAILAPDVQKIAKSMAKVCDGLPLGIIALAGSMRGETAIHVWKDALAELQKSIMGQDDMEHQVFKVLKYRFDRLDPNHHRQGKSDGYTELQLCFLYCSLYPEDYKIGREELVRKFISEELVGKKKSTKAQLDRGHSILDKLVNVCLLESTRHRKYGDSVKMHDLVRAMALKITEGKTMVMARHSLKEIPNEEERTKDLEKMSLIENGIKKIPPELSPNCPKLSTLLLCRNLLEYIPDSFFSQMHALCTLDLCNTCIKVLPNSVSDLESLKVLVLRLCRGIIYVPNLRKLKALRELDLSYIEIKEVPQVLEKLVNLKRLSLEGAYRLEMLPTGLLLNFPLPYQIQTPVEEIERLKNVCDFSRYIRSRPNWDTLYSIRLGSSYEGIDRWYNQVILHRYDLKKREEKDVTMLAQDIQHLIFDECEGLSNCLLNDFPRLNNPTSLETLIIFRCEGIECILTN